MPSASCSPLKRLKILNYRYFNPHRIQCIELDDIQIRTYSKHVNNLDFKPELNLSRVHTWVTCFCTKFKI